MTRDDTPVPPGPRDDFLAVVAKTADLWPSMDLRVIAVKVGNERSNILTRAYLDSRPSDQVPRFPHLPSTELVGSWQLVLPSHQIGPILKQVSGGSLSLDSIRIVYENPQPPSPTRLYDFNPYQFVDVSEPYRRSYAHWSCHELTAYGGSAGDLIRKVPGGRTALDQALRTCDVPYNGLDGLARFFAGLPTGIDASRVCSFETFAPLEVLLVEDKCRLERGHLAFGVRCASATIQRRVSLRLFAVGNDAIPLTVPIPLPDRWTASDSGFEVSGSYELGDRQSATLMLCVGDNSVHRLTVEDYSRGRGNDLLDAYELFDEDLEALSDSLSVEGRDGAAAFDPAVARLLLFAGFRVNRLSGDKRLEEGPDLLAHSDNPNTCVVVECTTGSLNSKGKLGKLVARVSEMRTTFPHLDVRGLMATSLERGRLSEADLDAASRDAIAVLAREELHALLGLASSGTPMAGILGYLQTQIRRKPPGSLSIGLGRP